MNLRKPSLLFGAIFLAVFWQSAFQGFRHLFGVQMDLLPALMVYASLHMGLGTVCLTALAGGLLFDSLSANPLGITVLPLLAAGLAINVKRDLILRDQAFAQGILGLCASAGVPVLTLVLLLSTSRTPPLFGWRTLWQVTFMALSGAAATPVIFILFDWLHRALGASRFAETSFRSDREIRRGK